VEPKTKWIDMENLNPTTKKILIKLTNSNKMNINLQYRSQDVIYNDIYESNGNKHVFFITNIVNSRAPWLKLKEKSAFLRRLRTQLQ